MSDNNFFYGSDLRAEDQGEWQLIATVIRDVLDLGFTLDKDFLIGSDDGWELTLKMDEDDDQFGNVNARNWESLGQVADALRLAGYKKNA